jgi:hypothetical protein
METVECRFCTGVVPTHARKCKHCGEWLKEKLTSGAPRAADADERVVCKHCQKKMIPRLITGPPIVRPQHGWTPVPKRSVCPFCGGTHMTFPASPGQKLAATVLAIVFVLIFGGIALKILAR